MLKNLLKVFSSEPKTSQTERGRRRDFRRLHSLEKLETRALFAGDAFIGIFAGGTWRLEGQAAAIQFGLPGDQPVMGDWNGDGNQTPGVFRNGTWVLDMTGNGFDAQDRVLQFGLPGDKAVAGDWNRNGIDTVGVYRNGQWFFDYDGDGYTHAVDGTPISFGLPGDIPVAGDWNGDGRDTPGVFRNGTWVLDLTGNGYDALDRVLQFGLPGAQPVAGDWNGNGSDSPAVLQNNQWFFDLEGNGFNGETGRPHTLGNGIAVAGQRIATVKNLPRGAVVNDSIARSGEIDRFQFHANAREIFQLNIATANASNPLSVRIVRPDGGTIGGVREITTFRRDRVTIPNNHSGNFIVEVRSRNSGTTGSYRIGLESLSTPSPDAIATAPGSVVRGTLAQPIQVDQYRVAGRAGQRFQIDVVNLNPNAGPLRVTVYKPGGVTNTGSLVVNTSRTIQFSVNNFDVGTYIIQVESANGLSTGQYQLRIR